MQPERRPGGGGSGRKRPQKTYSFNRNIFFKSLKSENIFVLHALLIDKLAGYKIIGKKSSEIGTIIICILKVKKLI